MSRPRGIVGDLRSVLRTATHRLVNEGRAGVTWMEAVQASGLSLGRSELERARYTMRHLVDAGELQRVGALPGSGFGRPPTLYAPAPQASARAAPAVEAVLRTWCAPAAARRG